jgi:mono/diheme cytochrome c family protein
MTKYPIRCVIALMIPALMLMSAAFAAGGDPENGSRLAQRWCAACHAISSNQREASADAPTFASIGSKPGFNAEKLALFLLEPHPKMPNMSLTRQEAMDLAAYIAKTGKLP